MNIWKNIGKTFLVTLQQAHYTEAKWQSHKIWHVYATNVSGIVFGVIQLSEEEQMKKDEHVVTGSIKEFKTYFSQQFPFRQPIWSSADNMNRCYQAGSYLEVGEERMYPYKGWKNLNSRNIGRVCTSDGS